MPPKKYTSKLSLPKIHFFPEVTSCMDIAFDLIREDRLSIWDSVIAKSQSMGRGQMRKVWISPEGNLYAALRLPCAYPFNTPAASIAISALCANALRSYGCDILIKWPNDLVLYQNDKLAKIAGILLEDRKNKIIAGIGINVAFAPEIDENGMDPVIPAACLAQVIEREKLPPSHVLWMSLVKHIYSMYFHENAFPDIWKSLCEDLLLWKNCWVECMDGKTSIIGRLAGVTDRGAAIIETSEGVLAKETGTIRSLH